VGEPLMGGNMGGARQTVVCLFSTRVSQVGNRAVPVCNVTNVFGLQNGSWSPLGTSKPQLQLRESPGRLVKSRSKAGYTPSKGWLFKTVTTFSRPMQQPCDICGQNWMVSIPVHTFTALVQRGRVICGVVVDMRKQEFRHNVRQRKSADNV
jgi:hypothetical protein